MDPAEQSLYEALGISVNAGAATDTQAEGSGGTEPESAAPAENNGSQQAEGSRPQTEETPAGGTENGRPQAEGRRPKAEEDEGPTGDGKKPQSKEENAKFARQRREREQAEAIQAAIQQERERIAAQLAAAQIPDPSRRGQYITNLDELQNLQKQRAMRNAARAMQDTGDLDEGQLQQLLQNTEAGRKMLADVEAARAAAAQAEADQNAAFRDRQVNLISRIDPTIKTFEDLQAAPEYAQFCTYVMENNLDWTDAYRLAAADRLAKARSAASRQQTLNSIQGKSHMANDQPRGGEGIDIPQAVEAGYRAMDPSITHEQALKKYAEYLRRTKPS